MELNLTFPVSKSLKQLDGDPGVWNPKIPRVGWKNISGWNHVKTLFSHDIMDVAELMTNEGIQAHFK